MTAVIGPHTDQCIYQKINARKGMTRVPAVRLELLACVKLTQFLLTFIRCTFNCAHDLLMLAGELDDSITIGNNLHKDN